MNDKYISAKWIAIHPEGKVIIEDFFFLKGEGLYYRSCYYNAKEN